MGPGDVRTRVAAAYERLGMPSWPDPHPGAGPARDEEYSRVTEPERYRVVHARARAWADSLGEVAGVQVEALGPVVLDDEGRRERFDRVTRLTSSRPGTLPLLLLELDSSPAVLRLGVVRPEIALAVLPHCGCDACDRGSLDLLDAIDQVVLSVIGGPFVLMRGPGWHAQWHPGGGSSGSAGRGPDHTRLMELCRGLADGEDVELPAGAEALVGRPWIG